jgi:hypothetical protein
VNESETRETRETRETVIVGPLVIESAGKETLARDEGRRQARKGRRKKKTIKVNRGDNGIDQRPDLRDFIERAFGTLTAVAFLFYCCCLGLLPKRTLWITIPLGLVFYVGLIVVGRRVHAKSEKRKRTGKRYKFMDVENESEWIFWLTKLGMIGAMFLLGWLWVTHNLKHDWYLTACVPVLILICMVFTPATSEPGDGGIDF